MICSSCRKEIWKFSRDICYRCSVYFELEHKNPKRRAKAELKLIRLQDMHRAGINLYEVLIKLELTKRVNGNPFVTSWRGT